MRSTAGAVVIGGGIHGASVAYHLAKAGVEDVVMLEKDYLAAGGTGRSGAGFRHQFGTEVNVRLASKAVRMVENLRDELEYKPSIDLLQKGYLMLAYTEGQLQQFTRNVELQRSIDPANLSVILTPHEIHTLNPYLNMDGILGGSFNPRDGHVNPWHFTQAYADAAARLGVDIEVFTPATGITVEGDRVTGVLTDKGAISTPVVVNCAGPWGGIVCEWVGVDIPLVSQRHQVVVTEAVEEICPMMVLSFTHGTWFKQTPHGSLLLGVGDPEHETIGWDQSSSWQFLQDVAQKMLFHMPALKDIRIVRQWAGLYDMTPDSQAILGPVDGLEGFYLDVGWSGHGLQLGPIVGKVMAEMITGQELTVDVRDMRHGRFACGELCPEPACV